jgi:hypothetical protein
MFIAKRATFVLCLSAARRQKSSRNAERGLAAALLKNKGMCECWLFYYKQGTPRGFCPWKEPPKTVLGTKPPIYNPIYKEFRLTSSPAYA